MSPEIQLDMRLSTFMETYPETEPVFAAHGLEQLVTPKSLGLIGPFLTLETALTTHGIAPREFLTLLEECLHKEALLDAPGLSETAQQGSHGLLTLMPCGLKVPFARAVASFVASFPWNGKESLNYSVESNLNHEVSYYPYVSHIESLDELPDIVVSSDFNAFFHHRFYNRFVKPGHFIDVMTDAAPNPLFVNAGISDPIKGYNILCVNPLIIVADLEKVGDRPLPRCWADLLDPMWHRSITLRGNEHFFCHAVLLPFFKEHGAAGMRALAHNIFDGRHPSQMVKTAGGGQSAALYVMPHFFAQKIPTRKAVKFIWPEDGALASPVTMLAKKSRANALKPIIDYLTGEELARVFTGASFPSPLNDIDNRLPSEAGLKWLGWDYIRTNDMEKVNAEIDRIFLPAVEEITRP